MEIRKTLLTNYFISKIVVNNIRDAWSKSFYKKLILFINITLFCNILQYKEENFLAYVN